MRYTRMREWLARTNRDMRSRDRDMARGRDRAYDMDYARGGRDRNYDMTSDMRNPYGSRGGYVVSDRRGSDYGYDRMGDYARDREYDRMGYDRNHTSADYERGGDYNQYDREYRRDMARRYGSFDYETEDYASRRDYGKDDYKLTSKEIKAWQRELKGADGTNGYKFEVDQVKQIAMQNNIHFEEYSPELLTAIANMLYSDYCKVLGSDITTYVKLAKAFLEDEDFDGEPEEKAYLYYNAIVKKED